MLFLSERCVSPCSFSLVSYFTRSLVVENCAGPDVRPPSLTSTEDNKTDRCFQLLCLTHLQWREVCLRVFLGTELSKHLLLPTLPYPKIVTILIFTIIIIINNNTTPPRTRSPRQTTPSKRSTTYYTRSPSACRLSARRKSAPASSWTTIRISYGSSRARST